MPARGQARRRSAGPNRDFDFEFRIRQRYDLGEFAYRATIEALKNIGAFVRKTARNATSRPKKNSSEPGDIWSSWKNKPLHYAIQFGVNTERLYAVVGPKTQNRKSPARNVPHVIEYGGITTMQARVYTASGLAAKQERKRRADRRKKTKKVMSARQMKAMRRRFQEEGGEKPIDKVSSKAVTYTYRMKPRPTMYISLMVSAPYIPNAMKYAFVRTRPAASRYFGPEGVPVGRFGRNMWKSHRRRFG